MIERHQAPGAFVSAWPLAGDDKFVRLPAAWRTSVAERLERSLHRHVLGAWYPRTVDYERGGFATDFDGRWRPMGPDERMLEYEARSTRTVARLGLAFPAETVWADYTRHGTRYLMEVMRDRADGGWFWLVDRDGAPLAMGTKHGHSTAYVITALIEIYRLTGDREFVDAAQKTFDWLDAALHDDINGGYHGWATRDGRPILKRSDVAAWDRPGDPLGHDIGLKDINVHSDLMESFRLLSEEVSSPKLKSRATELYELITAKFTEPDGRVNYVLTAELEPVAGPEQPGYCFQSAYRLRLLAQHVDVPGDAAIAVARQLVDHGLRVGWTKGRAGIVDVVGGRPSRRTWWVQTETALALAMLAVTTGEETYRRRLDNLIDLFESEMQDDRYLGWHQLPTSDWSLLDNLRPTRRPKAHRWKDPSHETDMTLMIMRMMRGLPDRAPLRG